MRTNLVVAVLLGVTVVAAACNETTAPDRPHVVTIFGIQAPANAAVSDTVRVRFSYYTEFCDTGAVLSVRPSFDEIRFTVTSWPTNRTCPAVTSVIAAIPLTAGYVVNPPHAAPLRLVFSEPTGGDSVRVVAP